MTTPPPSPPASRSWRLDWAGPHGTAWGTVNALLTTVTLAITAHSAAMHHLIGVTTAAMLLALGALGGIIRLLLRAAPANRRPPKLTLIYKLACWTGAGTWATYTAGVTHWTAGWFIQSLMLLIVGALAAGIIAAVATRQPPTADTEPTPPPTPDLPGPDEAARRRIEVAEQWVHLLTKHTGVEGWTVPAVQLWSRGNGYTVEAHAPEGGTTWKAVERIVEPLGGDLNLVHGGRLVCMMGSTRRAAVIDVTTVDVLAQDYPYPDNRPVHSINDPLAVGICDDGSPVGPTLRSYCMTLGGEAGSGKSNAGNILTAEIATTDDALEWPWDLTGKRWSAWLDQFDRGEIKVPPVDWVADTPGELLFMVRAADRVGLIRPQAYRRLMLDANDDKIPVSSQVPALIVSGDEIADVTSVLTKHPAIKDYLRKIVFEHRVAAVRAVFLPLRGTNDVIDEAIQSQCQVRGVMRVGSKAEAGWMFGNHWGFGPDDTPYPGCGGLVLQSGEEPIGMKWHRLLPRQIAEVARLVESRRPQLDEVSRLAANGRLGDGTPRPDLLPGELDCYDTRWERRAARLAAGMPESVSLQAGVTPPSSDLGLPDKIEGAQPMDAAVSALQKAMAALDAKVAAANAEAGGNAPPPDDLVIPADERKQFDRLIAEGFGDGDWDESDADEADETPPAPAHLNLIVDLVRAAGPQGIRPHDLRLQLADRGVIVHRDTLRGYMNSLRDDNPPKLLNPRRGRWVAADV
jgi:hypothetical protein